MQHILREDFNVTFTGGDPLYQAEALLPLAKSIKNAGYNIWCYTGFEFEELMKDSVPGVSALLDYIDVLVDGRFVEELKDTSLRFRGSSNQRIIDVRQSLTADSVIELALD